MSVKNQAVQPAISSAIVTDYKIPRGVKNKLVEDGKLRKYMTEVCGRTPPGFIRLKHADFLALDAAVRDQSKGAFNGYTVFWNSLPIKSERDK